MVTKEYAIVLTEVNNVLKFSTSGVRTRLPYKFRKFLVQNMDKNYEISIDLSKSLEEQTISDEAKNLIALIYRDYLVSDDQKQSLIAEELANKKQYEENLNKLYNPHNMFKNRQFSQSASLQMTTVKEKKFIDKLFDYIKSLFKKK